VRSLRDGAPERALFAVVLHEKGHVVGIGSLQSYRGLPSGAGGAAPWFRIADARIKLKRLYPAAQKC
jgi:hypothetical protein